MPQPFHNAVMTNSGARLLTKAQAGETKIQFTRIATGNGTYTAAENTLSALQNRTELKSQKNSYPLSNIEVFSDYSVKVTALITNSDPVTHEVLVTAGYFINEMGLFAKEAGGDDSTEVLYSVVTTAGLNGDFMPPYNGYSPAQIIQEFYATVGNSAEVTVSATNSAVALAEDVLELRRILNWLLGFWHDGNGMVGSYAGSAYDESAETDIIPPGMAAVNDETITLYSGVPKWLTGGSAGYVLLPATAEQLGGVKIGQGIDVDTDGTISANVDTSVEKAADLVESRMEDFSEEEIRSLFQSV